MTPLSRFLLFFSIFYFASINKTYGFTFGDVEVTNEIDPKGEKLNWCTVNREEQYKCNNLSLAIVRDRSLFGNYYFNLGCQQGLHKDECMRMIGDYKADITGLDSGIVFEAGRFNSLVPIAQEVQQSGLKFVYSVAVVKKGTTIGQDGLRSLRGVKACFPGVNSFAGWLLPIKTLISEGDLEIIDCNNHIKSVINFFGKSCAPSSLLDKNNPIGDNSNKLCELCTGQIGSRCTSGDPYAGFTGALRCLLEAGDIAFLKHSTVPFVIENHQEFSSLSIDKFELMCKDGSRRPIKEYLTCHWGTVPSNAIVTSTAKTPEQIKRIQKFLEKISQFYSTKNSTNYDTNKASPERDQFGNIIPSRDRDRYGNPVQRDQFGNPISNPYDANESYFGRSTSTSTENPYESRENKRYEKFDLFHSSRYGTRTDLLLEDSSVSLVGLSEDKQSYSEFLGQSAKTILTVRDCPVKRFTFCVTSDAELDKCVKMRTAMKAQLLKPDMSCYKAHSKINCMQAIRGGTADGVMLDAADVWEAARHYSLQPFLSEVYEHGRSDYFAVAVTKEQDASTELTYLKGKNTCHSGIGTAAGWVYPLAYLIANGWIRPYGCDAARAAAEWFSRSCVPGATSPEYNMGVPHAPLCRLCHGSTYSFCKRDASEAYYGDIGAIRCLVEGGGDVAFVRHSAVSESAGGRRREWWARNTLRDDFQLLCPDGTRGQITDYKRCNLGLVSANAMVTRGGEATNETEISTFTNLFMYAQQFYGTNTDDDEFSFSMFSSQSPHYDLIFSDGTRQLHPVTGEKRRPSKYVGRVFMRAHRLTDCAPTTSGSTSVASFYHLAWISIIYSIVKLLVK